MSTKFDLCELVVNWKSVGHRLHALQHGAGVAIAARIGTSISDGDFGDDEDVIVVWRDDELLNALGRMSEELDSVPVHFDVSADRQLVELLLSWKQGSEPFRDGARTTIWSPDSRRSAEDTAPCRGDGGRVGSCAAWARERSPRTSSRLLLLAGYLEADWESQRQGCNPNIRWGAQIGKLTRETGLGQ
jgi:hypothetical protein